MKRIKSILLIILLTFTLMNFMFYKTDKTFILPTEFPYIKFKINTALAPFNSAGSIQATKRAAENWFRQSKAKLLFYLDGETTQRSPHSPSNYECSQAAQEELFKQEKTVYSMSAEDPDCTGPACTFIWSCDDKILHFDIQVNSYDYAWGVLSPPAEEPEGMPIWSLSLIPSISSPAATVSYIHDLETVLTHEFGHASGMDHCKVGDLDSDCYAKIVSGQSNPSESEVMYKFVNPGVVKTNLSADDANGIRELYGELKTTLPVTGSYALDVIDIVWIGYNIKKKKEAGLDSIEAEQAQARQIQYAYDAINSGDTSRLLKKIPELNPGINFEEYVDLYYEITTNKLNSMTKEKLKTMRMLSSYEVVRLERIMDKYLLKPSSELPDKSLLESLIQKEIEFRKTIINEQLEKP